ncbi:MAG: hypothetical protein ABIP03_07830 [Aquihabitans sp.]
METTPQTLGVVDRDMTVRSSISLDVVLIVDLLENPTPLPGARTLLTQPVDQQLLHTG